MNYFMIMFRFLYYLIYYCRLLFLSVVLSTILIVLYLGVIIYDSCRDDPKEFVRRKLEQSKQSSGYIMKNSPNLVIGYGTMPNMKAFEEEDKTTGASVGLYMKHLIKHIR